MIHPVDGLPYRPDANPDCEVCKGYGVVDEGTIMAMLVPCPACFPDKQMTKTCTWTHEDGRWTGDCGIVWEFIDDGCEENRCFYCPRCGGKIDERGGNL